MAIVMTHRFITAMLADEIHVMKSGRIVESGTHQDLVLRKGSTPSVENSSGPMHCLAPWGDLRWNESLRMVRVRK